MVSKERETATVLLFKESGKYYTGTEWEIPTLEEVLERGGRRTDGPTVGPHCMKFSKDFVRCGGTGAVLVEEQEPWGYPHMFPPVRQIDGKAL